MMMQTAVTVGLLGLIRLAGPSRVQWFHRKNAADAGQRVLIRYQTFSP